MAEATPEVKWLDLDRAQRRRVARAVRKGRAVDDPRDAPYAVAFAEASLEWLSWKRRFRPVHLLLATLLVADLVFAGGWRPAVLLYPLLGFGFLRLRAPWLRRRAQTAREANIALAESLELPAVSVEMPGRALFHPGSRGRRRLIFSLAIVLAALVTLGVAAATLTNRETHRWARRANRVCAREQVRLAAISVHRLDMFEARRRANAVERDALVALDRVSPRTRPEKYFVAWKRYDVELDRWLLGRIAESDEAGIAVGRQRRRTAREHTQEAARRLGAKICAHG
jgi:hypothetical protein